MASIVDDSVSSAYKTYQTFNIIWADSTVNANDHAEVQHEIRTLLNNLIKFDQSNQCKDYIECSSVNTRFFVILSGRFAREIIADLQKLRQVSAMFIYCMDQRANLSLAQQNSKV